MSGRLASVSAAIVLACLLCACGGGGSDSAALQSEPAAAPANHINISSPDSFSLPAPAEIERQISSEPGFEHIWASDYASWLEQHSNRVFTGDQLNPTNLIFLSQWDALATPLLQDSAYATYAGLVNNWNGGMKIVFDWAHKPADPELLWIGVGNHTTGRWEWHKSPEGDVIELPSALDYASPTFKLCYFAVVVLDDAGAELKSARLLNLQEASVSAIEYEPAKYGTEAGFAAVTHGAEPLTYQWNFGEGAEPMISNDPEPLVTLQGPGLYNGSLLLDNDHTDGFLYEFEYRVLGDPATIVTAGPFEGWQGDSIQFTAEVSGTAPLSYEWDFTGIGSPESSTEASPTVQLSNSGTFNVSLTLSNADSSDTVEFPFVSKEKFVDIHSVDPLFAVQNGIVEFTAVVTGQPPFEYDWQFGAAALPSTSSSESVFAQVGAEGSYPCSLTVSNESGPAEIFAFTLTIGSNQGLVWPSEGHDRGRSHRSSSGGPQDPAALWNSSSIGAFTALNAAPIVGSNGNVYFSAALDAGGAPQGKLFSLTPSGGVNWTFDFLGSSRCTPAIGADGVVYVGGARDILARDSNDIYAVYPDGSLRWRTNVQLPVVGSITVAADGKIYARTDILDGLFAFDNKGNILWSIPVSLQGSPILANDGTVICARHGSSAPVLLAFTPDGELRWASEGLGGSLVDPVVTALDQIFLPMTDPQEGHMLKLSAHDINGALEWDFETGVSTQQYTNAALRSDGDVAFAAAGQLYTVFSESGLEASSHALPRARQYSLILDDDDVSFIAEGNSDGSGNQISAVASDGEVLWSSPLPARPSSEMAMALDGSIYIGLENGQLWAIGD